MVLNGNVGSAFAAFFFVNTDSCSLDDVRVPAVDHCYHIPLAYVIVTADLATRALYFVSHNMRKKGNEERRTRKRKKEEPEARKKKRKKERKKRMRKEKRPMIRSGRHGVSTVDVEL